MSKHGNDYEIQFSVGYRAVQEAVNFSQKLNTICEQIGSNNNAVNETIRKITNYRTRTLERLRKITTRTLDDIRAIN